MRILENRNICDYRVAMAGSDVQYRQVAGFLRVAPDFLHLALFVSQHVRSFGLV